MWPLKEGEIVLVADDREKRLNWKMGVVRQLIRGRYGRSRAAVVQVTSGLLRRPIRINWNSVLRQTISRPLQVLQTILIKIVRCQTTRLR